MWMLVSLLVMVTAIETLMQSDLLMMFSIVDAPMASRTKMEFQKLINNAYDWYLFGLKCGS